MRASSSRTSILLLLFLLLTILFVFVCAHTSVTHAAYAYECAMVPKERYGIERAALKCVSVRNRPAGKNIHYILELYLGREAACSLGGILLCLWVGNSLGSTK